MATLGKEPIKVQGRESAGAVGARSPFAMRLSQGNLEHSIPNESGERSTWKQIVRISAARSREAGGDGAGALPGTLSEKEFCHAKNPEESFLSSRCNLLLFLGIYSQNVLI